MDLEGRTALVTGAASGIGQATALAFARAGAHVALLDVDDVGAKRTADLLADAGVDTVVCRADLRDVAEVQEAVRAVHERFGRLDALANVAAIYPHANVLDVTEELWDRVTGINLRGLFFCCQEALRLMAAQGSGAIVNVASGAAFRAIDGLAVYSASKAGVVGMSRVLALEFARTGVRVNVVAPGHTASDHLVEAVGRDNVEAIAESLVPGRFMQPEESAEAILWLCSDAASGVNGAIINVNGGNHMPQG